MRVLELGAEGDGAEEGDDDDRKDLLMLTSLVCRRWRPIAQKMLWREVEPDDRAMAEEFLASPAFGVYQTNELTLWGNEVGVGETRITSDSVRRLICVVPGITALDLSWFDQHTTIDLSVFDTPNLSGTPSIFFSDC